MKKIMNLNLLFCIFIISCQNSTNKYEKIIEKYAQTDHRGIFTDCHFMAIEIKELPAITVADSTKILEAEFNKNKEALIVSINSNIKYAQDNLSKEEKAKYRLSTLLDTYKNRIKIEKERRDSIQNSSFVNMYENQPSDKILLQPVECRYSYTFPPGNPKQERTDIFYFTSDLQKIVMQVKQK